MGERRWPSGLGGPCGPGVGTSREPRRTCLGRVRGVIQAPPPPERVGFNSFITVYVLWRRLSSIRGVFEESKPPPPREGGSKMFGEARNQTFELEPPRIVTPPRSPIASIVSPAPDACLWTVPTPSSRPTVSTVWHPIGCLSPSHAWRGGGPPPGEAEVAHAGLPSGGALLQVVRVADQEAFRLAQQHRGRGPPRA